LDQNALVLESETTVSTDADAIKAQIVRHKEFQRMLGTKQSSFDAVQRMGRSIKEKGPATDAPALDGMLNALRNKWNNICGNSVAK